MKKLIGLVLLFTLCVAVDAQATARGTLGRVPSITMAGVELIHPDPSKPLIVLHTRCAGTSGQDCTFRAHDGSAGYQPGSGLKFVSLALLISEHTASVTNVNLVTSSDDVGIAGSSAATIVTSYIGSDSAYIATDGVVGPEAFFVWGFELRNDSADYFSINNQAAVASSAWLIGYETSED